MTIMMDRDRLFSSMAENRAREVVAHIGFLRNLRQLYEGGAPRYGWRRLTVSASRRSARCSSGPAARRRMCVQANHGGTAYELDARCAVGEIDPETMRAELIGWEYGKPMAPSGYPDVDDVSPHAEGGFNHHVGRALTHGFLTDEDYDLILYALAE